jgi:hypothetical protein
MTEAARDCRPNQGATKAEAGPRSRRDPAVRCGADAAGHYAESGARGDRRGERGGGLGGALPARAGRMCSGRTRPRWPEEAARTHASNRRRRGRTCRNTSGFGSWRWRWGRRRSVLHRGGWDGQLREDGGNGSALRGGSAGARFVATALRWPAQERGGGGGGWAPEKVKTQRGLAAWCVDARRSDALLCYQHWPARTASGARRLWRRMTLGGRLRTAECGARARNARRREKCRTALSDSDKWGKEPKVGAAWPLWPEWRSRGRRHTTSGWRECDRRAPRKRDFPGFNLKPHFGSRLQ